MGRVKESPSGEFTQNHSRFKEETLSSGNYGLVAVRNMLIVVVLAIGCGHLLSLYVSAVFTGMREQHPDRFEGSEGRLRFPTDVDDLRVNVGILKAAKEYSPEKVVVGFMLGFLFKHTFAIPGSALLNVLCSAVLGFWFAFPLVTLMTAIGATCCYFVSYGLGKPVVEHFLKKKLASLRARVNANQSDLFSFLVFLRLVPFTPNWFVNIASPILGIPAGKFFMSVLLGLMPYNFICCQAGEILSQLHSTGDIIDKWTILKLLGIAFLYIIPKWAHSRWAKSKRRKDSESSANE